MRDDQVRQEYEEMIRRDVTWYPIFRRLPPGENITGANVVGGFLYLLHESRLQLGIPDHLYIESKAAKEFLIH